MKTNTTNYLILLLATLVISLSSCSSTKKASTAATPSKTVPEQTFAAYTGTWGYIVKGTPDGDTKGDMIISLNGNVLKGAISAGGSQTDIQDLKIENNLLSGTFFYNGMTISMNGTFNGNSYEGKVEAQGYAFPMTATKN